VPAIQVVQERGLAVRRALPNQLRKVFEAQGCPADDVLGSDAAV
jgi:hypothetical protein